LLKLTLIVGDYLAEIETRLEILLLSLYYSEGRTMNELSSLIDFTRSIIYSELQKLLIQGFVSRSKLTRLDKRLGRRIHFFSYFLTKKAISYVQSSSQISEGSNWAFAF
jgi:predicted transcriptional regulator